MTHSRYFGCDVCTLTHNTQAFVSHSRKDQAIKQKLAKACCDVGVAPYMYEFSPEYNSSASPADDLSIEIERSKVLFVLLGEAISSVFWTQAWIGFEVGIFKALKDPQRNLEYAFVFQDIRQDIEVCVPTLDILYLFDFNSDTGWDQCRGLVEVIEMGPSSGKFHKEANRFRTATLKANVKCDNCKSEYEAWIAKRNACLLGKGFNLLNHGPEMLAECTTKCPSCGKLVTRCFAQMLFA